jgi:PAS domain S-box-containing protein
MSRREPNQQINNKQSHMNSKEDIMSEHTSSSGVSDRHSRFLRIGRMSVYLFDIPAIIFLLAISIAGIAIALSTFFAVRETVKQAYKHEIDTFAVQQGSKFETDFTEFLDAARAIAAQFDTYYNGWNVSNEYTVTLDKFEQFVNRSRLLKAGFTDFTWIPRIPSSQLVEYIENMRRYTIYPYTEYNVFAIADLKHSNPLPSNYKNGSDFYPITYIYPLQGNEDALRYDPTTEPTRKVVIEKAIATDEIALTPPVKLSRDNSTAYQVYIPTWLNREHSGIVRGVLRLEQYLKRFQFDDISHVAIFDETDGITSTFLYTTLSKGTITRKEVQSMEYHSVQTVEVADRLWTIYFVPKDHFFDRLTKQASRPWVALFVTLAGTLILDIGLVMFLMVKRILLKIFTDTAHKEQQLLVDHGKKLETLLDKIAAEEHRFRAIMNTVMNPILIVKREGTFIDANKAFQQKFGMLKSQLEATSFSKLFPEYANPVDLHNALKLSHVKVTVKSNYGQSISTEAHMELLHYNINSSAEEDGVYILMLESLDLHNNPKSLSLRLESDSTLEFNQIINNADLRKPFKEFCIKHHNEESILFVEIVQEYKNTEKTHERVKLQEKIVKDYLTQNAKYELNMAQKLVASEMAAITDNLGQVDCFDNLCKNICSHLKQETYPLYRKSMEEEENSLIKFV